MERYIKSFRNWYGNHPCSPNTQKAEAGELEFEVSLACLARLSQKERGNSGLGVRKHWISDLENLISAKQVFTKLAVS